MKSRPVMYLFLNQALGMSKGKAAAQVAHAAVEAYVISDPKLADLWRVGDGKHYTKLVMLAEDAEQLTTYREYIEERGFKTHLVIDEGRTEIKPFSKTALGVEIVDKADPHVQATFENFTLYPPDPNPHEYNLTPQYVTPFGHEPNTCPLCHVIGGQTVSWCSSRRSDCYSDS